LSKGRFAGLENNVSAVEHVPVLAQKLVEQIKLPPDGIMVDATIGHGGHSLLFGRQMGPKGVIIGLDVDEKSIRRAQSKLGGLSCKVIILKANFSQIAEKIHEQGIRGADFILADLGVSSSQLADTQAGLSFQTNMPLDMRMDERLETTAADIIKRSDEKELAELIYKFGEEKASRRIARTIAEYRRNRPITTTRQLAIIVCKALGQPETGRISRIHPATKTFQALRMAVNRETENLQKLLESVPQLLNKNGRVAIISFHSLEDRAVKTNFKENEGKNIYKILTKKPITAEKEELALNPRARSAKLRIAEKI